MSKIVPLNSAKTPLKPEMSNVINKDFISKFADEQLKAPREGMYLMGNPLEVVHPDESVSYLYVDLVLGYVVRLFDIEDGMCKKQFYEFNGDLYMADEKEEFPVLPSLMSAVKFYDLFNSKVEDFYCKEEGIYRATGVDSLDRLVKITLNETNTGVLFKFSAPEKFADRLLVNHAIDDELTVLQGATVCSNVLNVELPEEVRKQMKF